MKKSSEGYKTYEFGEIPNDWEVKKIGNIFNDLRAGSTPSRKIQDYYTGDIPWITSGELKYNIIYDTVEKITEGAVKDTNLELYPEGTFFIAITGLEAAGTRGSCAISGVKATTNQSCMAFKPKDYFSNKYLYHWYRLHGEYIGLKYTQGTKQQSLNNKIVAELEIPVPKLKEQERIASILSTVDEQIENVDALIEKNKELKKGLMQQLLTKGIGYTKFKKTDIGEIPEEWEINRLKQIIDVGPQNGLYKSKEFYTGNKYKIVELKDLYTKCKKININKLNNIDLNEKEAEQYKLNEGDLLVNRVSKAVDGIGRIKIFPNNRGVVCYESNMMRITLDYEVALSEFIYYLSESSIFRNQIMGTAKISNQTSISQGDLEKILICLPNIKEQEHIVRILSEVDTKIEGYENKKHKLEELKKGLMQQLLTGRTRVI